MLVQHLDLGAGTHSRLQRAHDFRAGRIAGVHDATLRMPALLGQVQTVSIAGKVGALLQQPLDAAARMLGNEAHRVFLAQAGARRERVGHMRVNGIRRVHHGGDATLRVATGAFGQRAFGKHGDTATGTREPQRNAQPCDTAAQNKDLGSLTFGHVRAGRS